MTTYSYTSVGTVPVPKKKKRSLLPVLTGLFVISYTLMTVLVVEQGSAIQSQHNLIQVLMQDSTELWSAKAKAIGDKQAAQNATKAPGAEAPSAPAQPPAAQAPSKHAHKRPGKTAAPAPEVPPVPASDWMDQRRALRTI